MFSVRISVVAFMAIVLITNFDQGATIKCRVCISTENNNCISDPDKISLAECNSKPLITTTSTSVTPSEATETDATSSSDTAETDTNSDVTTPMDAESSTSEMDTTTSVTYTDENDASTISDGISDTHPMTSDNEDDEDGYTTTTTINPWEISSNSDESIEEDEKFEQPEPKSIIYTRSRRNVPFLRAAESACFKLVYTDDDKEVVERGCLSNINGCDKVKQDRNRASADCYACDNEDGCNSSSRIELGILFMIVPVGLVTIFGL